MKEYLGGVISLFSKVVDHQQVCYPGHAGNLATVNDKSLEGLKFGESAKKSIWRKKVWRISLRILVVYNISYMLSNKFGEISQFAKFAKLWSLQTFVVYGI